jgi:hypothetical protein
VRRCPYLHPIGQPLRQPLQPTYHRGRSLSYFLPLAASFGLELYGCLSRKPIAQTRRCGYYKPLASVAL